MKIIFILLLAFYIANLASTPPVMPEVRSIFGTTGNAEAREYFEQGLLLLHNFEYPDAADLFRKAQAKDPDFALAYWGEAMTCNHPVWLSQDTEDARAILNSYRAASAGKLVKLSSLDSDLVASLEVLYGRGSKAERDKAYAEFMGSLSQKYAGNHDVAAFYSLALLGQAAGWNEGLCTQAAVVAGEVLRENPKHAGALHYFIHAQDHPDFANNAWEQANDYAEVASYSGHALHMPSHIYLALGRWNDVVRSNEVSWQAGVYRKESRKLSNNSLNYHAHWWLAYGYLQQGRYEKAREIIAAQEQFTLGLPSPSSRNHFVIMRGHYLAETNEWKNKIANIRFETSDLRIGIRSLDRFVLGLRAFKNGDLNTLIELTGEIERDIKQARQVRRMSEGIADCGTAGYDAEANLTQAAILVEELKALVAYSKKDWKLADSHFQNAVTLEEKNGHFFGPPEILKPTNEFYGEFLLATNRPDEAIANFRISLRKAPGRNQSLHGLAKSLSLSGDAGGAKKIRDALHENLAKADTAEINLFFSTP